MPRSVAQPRSLLAIDPLLGLLGLALILVGLIAISSASIEYGDWHYGNPWHHTQRHLVYILAATVAGVITYRIPVGFWEQTGWAWLLVALALLVLVLVPGIGKEGKGSQRWIQLGAFTLQPSELAKVALVIYLAGYMVRQEEEVRGNWRGFLKPMAVVGAVALLLMVEPDFGATVICAGTAMGMLFLGGVRLGHFLLMLLVGLLGLVALVFSAPYRVARLTAYTDPWADPFGAGFQLIQSLIAFGRGEWLGAGLGNSVQKLFYLPEAHNDFVFSIWAEETGFIGAMLVMGLFAALIGRILWVARQALSQDQKFGAYVCYGTALIFSGQAFVNTLSA